MADIQDEGGPGRRHGARGVPIRASGRRSWRLAFATAMAVLTGTWLAGPAAVEAQAVACPRPPITVADLIALEADRGPLSAFPLAVTPMNERALACFGGRELRFTAFVDSTGGVGGTQAYAITPAWLTNARLVVFGSSREVEPGTGDGPFFFISTRPGSGDLQSRFARRWVTIRGHFRDRAASTCTASGAPGQTPSRQQAIAICRTMFVLTSIRAASPPDTATIGPATSPARGGLLPFAAGATAGLVVLVRTRSRPSRPARRRDPG
jgi:hypothetical protein